MDLAELRRVKLFADFSESELNKLVKQFREVEHPAGSKFIIRGQGGVGFMMILRGDVEIVIADGRTRHLDQSGAAHSWL